MPEELIELQTTLEVEKKKYQDLLEYLSGKLAPCVVDEGMIKGKIEALLEVEEKLRIAEKKLVSEEEKHKLEASELTEKVIALEKRIEGQQKDLERETDQNKNLLNDLQKIQETLKHIQEKRSMNSLFKNLIERGTYEQSYSGNRWPQNVYHRYCDGLIRRIRSLFTIHNTR